MIDFKVKRQELHREDIRDLVNNQRVIEPNRMSPQGMPPQGMQPPDMQPPDMLP